MREGQKQKIRKELGNKWVKEERTEGRVEGVGKRKVDPVGSVILIIILTASAARQWQANKKTKPSRCRRRCRRRGRRRSPVKLGEKNGGSERLKGDGSLLKIKRGDHDVVLTCTPSRVVLIHDLTNHESPRCLSLSVSETTKKVMLL